MIIERFQQICTISFFLFANYNETKNLSDYLNNLLHQNVLKKVEYSILPRNPLAFAEYTCDPQMSIPVPDLCQAVLLLEPVNQPCKMSVKN